MPSITCPTCGKSVTYSKKEEVPFRPFCCQRCKMIDLGKWLKEEYRISEEVPDRRTEEKPPPMPEDDE